MKYKIVCVVCTGLLALAAFALPAKSQGKFPWPEGKAFAISLSFDDARLSNIEQGIPLLDRHGVKATFYVHPNKIKERLPEWKAAANSGHELGNHTIFHPCSENFLWSRSNPLESYTLDKMRAELIETSDQIRELVGVTPTTFAYPCGQTFVGRGEGKKSYVPLVAELFTGGRGWLDEAPADPWFCDLAELSGMKMDDLDFDDLLPVIAYARANNLWLVLVGHDTEPERSGQVTTLSFLEELCSYIKAHDDVWSAPVGEVSAYIEQTRTNGRLSTVEPLPIHETIDGDLHLRAALGKGYGPKIEYMADWKAYGWWTANDSVVWNIDVAKPGKFDAWLEWSISDEEAGKMVEFHFGDQIISKIIPTSGSWETFQAMDLGVVELKPGRHRVVVKPADPNAEGHFMDVRTIRLTRH